MQVLGYHKKCWLLYQKQGGKCFYCQDEFEYHKMSRDHFNPRSKGYKQFWNVVLSCRDCNSEKSSFTLYEFREITCRKLARYLRRPRVMRQKHFDPRQMQFIKGRFKLLKRLTYLINNPDAFLEVAGGPHLKNKNFPTPVLIKNNKK